MSTCQAGAADFLFPPERLATQSLQQEFHFRKALLCLLAGEDCPGLSSLSTTYSTVGTQGALLKERHASSSLTGATSSAAPSPVTGEASVNCPQWHCEVRISLAARNMCSHTVSLPVPAPTACQGTGQPGLHLTSSAVMLQSC